MLKLFFLIFSLSTIGSLFSESTCTPASESALALGDLDSKEYWVYLCGLTRDFNSFEERQNRAILNRLGQHNNLHIIAVKSQWRSAEFNDKLYWPHANNEQTLATFQSILLEIDDRIVSGYIGFSSGGFFLNQLVQITALDAPVISIGAGGCIASSSEDNILYLLIGKNDSYHFETAHNYYIQAKNTQLSVHLIEYNGGHTIPEDVLDQLLSKIKSDQPKERRSQLLLPKGSSD